MNYSQNGTGLPSSGSVVPPQPSAAAQAAAEAAYYNNGMHLTGHHHPALAGAMGFVRQPVSIICTTLSFSHRMRLDSFLPFDRRIDSFNTIYIIHYLLRDLIPITTTINNTILLILPLRLFSYLQLSTLLSLRNLKRFNQQLLRTL